MQPGKFYRSLLDFRRFGGIEEDWGLVPSIDLSDLVLRLGRSW